MLKFHEAEVADNLFEDNKLYGKKARGADIPKEAIKDLSTRPEIKILDAGPKAPEMMTAASS